MKPPAQKRFQRASASFCLLAIALLYAPLAVAALLTRVMSCCSGDYCPIAQHHHHKLPAAPPQESSPMDCDHGTATDHDMGSMTCCQNSDFSIMPSSAFLLPSLAPQVRPLTILHPLETAHAIEIPRSLKPPSPPPRFSSADL